MAFFADFQELSERSDFALAAPSPDRLIWSNPVCGDQVQVGLEIEEGVIRRVTYWAQGCWPVGGCLELLGRRLPGCSVDEVRSWQVTDLLSWVHGVPVSKRHAFSVVHRALQAALTESGKV